MVLFDCSVGNPPYGKDSVGSSKKMHFIIMKNTIRLSKIICFIMPSKCLYDISLSEERKMLKKSGCEKISIEYRNSFPTTQMPETAIYCCDKSSNKYDDKLNFRQFDNEIEKVIFEYLKKDDTLYTHTIRIDGELNEDELRNIYLKMSRYKYFINVSYANFAMNGDWFAQSELKNIGVVDKDYEKRFIVDNHTPKFIIGFGNILSANNVYKLLNSNLLRLCLWLCQDDRNMKQKVYELIPDLDYRNILCEKDLLKECGILNDELQDNIINYVNKFDFNNKRNNRFLKNEGI